MAYVNHVKSKNLSDSISDSKNNANKLYYPTDSEAVVMNGKKYGVPNITGKINLSSINEVKAAQDLLNQTNEVAFYLVTDSSGKIPSSQSCYNIPSDIVKQLSLTSPNSVTNATLALATSSTTLDAVGVNVGDLVALTRVKVKVSDLTAALGISLSLSGEIEMYQYKVLSMNDAKATGHSEASAGVMGLMSPWDKGQVNKIGTIESNLATASSELNRGNKKTMFTADNYNIDQCLDGGIYLYGRTGRSMAGNHSDEYYIVSVDTRYNRSDSKYYVTQRVYSVNYKNRAFERLIITSATNNYNGTYNDWIQLTEEQYFSKADKTDFDAIRTWYNNVVGADSDEVINKWGEIVAFLNNIPEGDTLDGIITALNTGLDNLEEKHTQEINAVNEEITDIKDGITKVGKAYVADNVGDLSAGDIQGFIDDVSETINGLDTTYAKKGEALKSAGISVNQGTDKATIILEGQYAEGTAFNPSASGVVIPAATTSKAGLMSGTDKTNLNKLLTHVGNFKREYDNSANNTYYKLASFKITGANHKHPRSFFLQGSQSTMAPALITVKFTNTTLADTDVAAFEYVGETNVGNKLSLLKMEDTKNADGVITAKNYELWAETTERSWGFYKLYPLTLQSDITFHEGVNAGTLPTAVATTACSLGSWDSKNITDIIDGTTVVGASKNAQIAEKATKDGAGNIIVNTYATKTVATTSANGLMSSDMLKKIDNIQLGVGDIPIIQMLQEDAANQILIPYMQNDIAYPIARGGYIKMWKDGVESTLTDTICNGLPDFVVVGTSNNPVSEIIIEIDTNKALQNSQRVYIAFSSSLWRAKSIKLETKVAASDEWIVTREVTDFSGSVFSSNLPTVDATPYRYLRFTLSNFNKYQCRISDIGVTLYDSKGLKNIVLPLGGGEMYGPIHPYKDVAYDLGSGSKRWKRIYAENFQGTASRATADDSGKNIAETYATKTEMNSYKPNTLAKGGYINTLQESSNAQFIPFFQNEFAHLIERGGSVSVAINGTEYTRGDDVAREATERKRFFDGCNSYYEIPTSAMELQDTITITINIPYSYRYAGTIYCLMPDFWRGKNVKFELFYPSLNNGAGEWHTMYEGTNLSNGLVYQPIKNLYDANGNVLVPFSTGWNKLRVTITNFTAKDITLRIAEIGYVSLESRNSTAICLPRNGGDIYGSITPLNSSSYDLGASNKKWKTIHADTFQGKATVAADVDVVNNVALGGDRPLIWAGGTVGNSSNSGATDLYKSYGDLSYNPSQKRLTTGLFNGVLESVRVPNSQSYLLQYYAGRATIGDEVGNAKEGSHADPNLWSYPTGSTVASDTKANIQTLRFKWSNDYFHDLFMSPNREYLWHRRVLNGNAYPWKKIVESDADGNVVLDGGLTINKTYNVKTEIDKKSNVIDVTALFALNGTVAGLTQVMLCKATLYAQGSEGDGSIPVKFYPSGSLRDGIGTNPTTGYLVAESISQVGSSISVDKRISTITIDSSGATCTGVETRYGEL